jgi:glycosyltransferase involved in cell wall biosynthesis
MPIYRKGVFEKLSSNEEIDLTVCCTEDFPAGLRMIRPDEVSFELRDIRTRLIRIPCSKSFFSFQSAMLLSMILKKYDVYVLPNTLSYVDVWLCLLLSRVLGLKVCLWGHGKGSLNGHVANWFRKLFMTMADAVIFYSDAAKEVWRLAGIPCEKMFVAYNALDTEASAKVRSAISDSDIAEFLRSRGFLGKKLIIFIGRLQERKRPDLIVDAMVRIINRVPEAHAIIIGDGVMKETIQRRISDLELANHVSLVGAIFDEQSIAYYLMTAKLAVIPAHAGLFIQHAFDYGLPIVVGNDFRSHPPEIELVKEGENGMFFENGDSNHLADQIIKLLLDEENRLKMSCNAKMLIDVKYNVNSMAEGLLQAIRHASKPVC